MTSQVDIFLGNARDISNPVIGTTAVTLSGGVILDGVWSTVSLGGESEEGGFQFDAVASVIVPASSSINKALQGQRCTYEGEKLRVRHVEMGTIETTVLFEHETEGLT